MKAGTAAWLASEPMADEDVMLRVIAVLAVSALVVLATMLGVAALRQERNAEHLRERLLMRAELATWQRWRAATAAIDSSLHQLVLLGDEAVRRQTAAPQQDQAITAQATAPESTTPQPTMPESTTSPFDADDRRPMPGPGGRRLSTAVRQLTDTHVEVALTGDLDPSQQEVLIPALAGVLAGGVKMITINLAEARVHGRAGIDVLLHAQTVINSLGVRLQVSHAAGLIATALAVRGVELSVPS
jgi:anti-anti-sigma regulatory factor